MSDRRMGRYLGEFSVGETIVTHRRTITETDLVLYAGLTGDNNPVHMDARAAESGQFGQRLMHGPFFIGLAFGLLSGKDVIDGTTVALKSVDWTFAGPVGIGDTVGLEATVAEVSPDPQRQDRGDLVLELMFRNQDDAVVSKGAARLLMYRET